MPKPNRKYAYADTSSYQGKRWSYKVLDSKIIEGQKTAPMSNHFVWPITQWVLIQSHDPGFVLKPRCHSSLYNHTRSSAYVGSSYHINLSKMSKHWGSFLSHCTSSKSLTVTATFDY